MQAKMGTLAIPLRLDLLQEKNPLKLILPIQLNLANSEGIMPLCASFEGEGKMALANPASPHVCVAMRHGHFGLVIESPPEEQLRKRESQWKIAVGSTIGAALGAFLLGLLVVAMFVRVKKKSRMEELERRAYEEEALQVSMVGHVRAPTATVTRTTPTAEHECLPPCH
ncbi:DUF1191 domain-containing protein [Quillaja saponaria]|uniref:DUF1191 domain-containing protein n=1 Tax=Quillaja saponaria TaxID=32244 RepID=A0AAD7KS97_QUISA|nr:DUF1191 domain-containing protein [Quillaja saponaria]